MQRFSEAELMSIRRPTEAEAELGASVPSPGSLFGRVPSATADAVPRRGSRQGDEGRQDLTLCPSLRHTVVLVGAAFLGCMCLAYVAGSAVEKSQVSAKNPEKLSDPEAQKAMDFLKALAVDFYNRQANFDRRQDEVIEQSDRNDELREMVAKLEAEHRQKQAHIEMLEEDLQATQAAGGNLWRWTIDRPSTRKARLEPFGSFGSQKFALGGLSVPWRLEIFPHGADSRSEGVQVRLECKGSSSDFNALVEARVSIDGHVTRWTLRDKHLSWRSETSGWRDFPGFAWPTSDENPVRIEVEFIEPRNK